MTEPLLQVEQASKSFPGVQALSGVDFELRQGEVHALVGENGAGKSTLMKLIGGIHTMDHGRILVDGDDVVIDDPASARDAGISVIHQEFHLTPALTVAQNIFLGREPRRGGMFLDEALLNQRASELFEELGIPMDVRAEVSTLSVAQQQLVEIAKALSFNARVLVMDEPTAALNHAEVNTLFDIIRQFRSPRTAVVYISHRLEELRVIADRITVLRDGHGIEILRTEDTSTDEVISLMVGRALTDNTRPTTDAVSTDPVLQVRGLSTKPLLRDVSFDLHRGEILGFAGLMGAGRTEVARALVGADPSTAESVHVNREPTSIRHPADAVELGIGYLSEDRKRYGLMLNQDVRANIMLASLPQHTTGGFVRDRAGRRTAADMVDSLRIKTHSLGQTTRNLSGGNQQKIVLGKWLARDCDILVVDEPTRGIDVGAKEEIYDLLNALAARGTSIIMISSELEEVLRMSHRIAVMCAGRITAVLDNAAADQETIMEHATSYSS